MAKPREVDDSVLAQRQLQEQRDLREALQGREDRKKPKPAPGVHWYKDKENRDRITKG